MTTSATGSEEVATTTPSSVSRDSSEAVGYPWLRASARDAGVEPQDFGHQGLGAIHTASGNRSVGLENGDAEVLLAARINAGCGSRSRLRRS